MSNPAVADEFLVTKEHRRFIEFCNTCRRYGYIGLCYGPPGVGKTLSSRTYSCWDRIEYLSTLPLGEEFPPDPDIATCCTLFYTPPVANTPRRIEQEVECLQRRLTHVVIQMRFRLQELNVQASADAHQFKVELLIVDEADRLKTTSLEHIRDTYDRGQFGLILIGMPGLEKRLSRYPQLYSRVGFVHHFKPLDAEEMQFILQHKWETLGLKLDPSDFTDAEAISAIIRITGGNFRLLQRLFTQIERIMQINELSIVTKEVVETARDFLVIGPT